MVRVRVKARVRVKVRVRVNLRFRRHVVVGLANLVSRCKIPIEI
jgi:hypothetical protein